MKFDTIGAKVTLAGALFLALSSCFFRGRTLGFNALL